MIISLVSPCATVGAYKLMQGQETFYGTVKVRPPAICPKTAGRGVPRPYREGVQAGDFRAYKFRVVQENNNELFLFLSI